MSKLMLTRTGTTVLKNRRRYSRYRRPRRQSAPTVLQRSNYRNGISPGQSPTGLSHIPEFARMRADLWRARSDPIQCRCDSLKANSDYLRATSDMLRLKSEALRSKSEQICRKRSDDAEDAKELLQQSEEMKTKAEHLRRKSDALRVKMELLRKESESAFVFPDFTTAGNDNFLHLRPSSPSNTLLLPTPISEVPTTPEAARTRPVNSSNHRNDAANHSPRPMGNNGYAFSLSVQSPRIHLDGGIENCLVKPGSPTIFTKLTPPPSDKPIYESTVIWAEVEDTDAHYSVIGNLCEATVEARHPCDFIHRSMFIIGGTWPVTVFTLVLLALPLVMTAIGVNYLHECPREPKLPIYLVVGGCFGIIKLIFLLWKQIKRHRDDVIDLHDDDDLLTMTRMTNMALNVFLSVWFVFGHYWLIRIWKPHFKAPLHEPRNWCDETVFFFTFWQLVICHIIIGLVIVTAIILYCCYVCVKCFVQEDGSQAVGSPPKPLGDQQQQQQQGSKR